MHVLCGRPRNNYQQQQYVANGVQRRNGVTIHRVRDPQWGNGMIPRAFGMATFLAGSSLRSLRVPKPDVIVTETDPPVTCLMGGMVHRFRGAKLICYLQDIYPDVAAAVGVMRNRFLLNMIRRMFTRVYRRADRVIVLSDDMRGALTRTGVPAEKIEVIHNWVDTELVVPIKENNRFRHQHDLEDKFVVMYSGNMGLTQRLDDVLDAAEILKDNPEIVFALVGHGSKRAGLEQSVRERGLTNVRFFDFQPKEELANSLSAANLQLVLLDEAVKDYLMPSKFYGTLAAGTPTLAVAPKDSELARLCLDNHVGLVVPNGSARELAEAIVDARASNGHLSRMGSRARELAHQFDRGNVVTRFALLLSRLLSVH